MDTIIVYESAWGNTRAIAEAVAEGVASTTRAPLLVAVEEAPPANTITADLLVVGGPTHAFGLSRPKTRADAAGRGGHPGETGLREWIMAADAVPVPVAAFDTRVRHPRLPGAASATAAKLLRRRGARLLAGPESFYVEDYEGPILPGELDRARSWGVELIKRLPAIT